MSKYHNSYWLLKYSAGIYKGKNKDLLALCWYCEYIISFCIYLDNLQSPQVIKIKKESHYQWKMEALQI